MGKVPCGKNLGVFPTFELALQEIGFEPISTGKVPLQKDLGGFANSALAFQGKRFKPISRQCLLLNSSNGEQ